MSSAQGQPNHQLVLDEYSLGQVDLEEVRALGKVEEERVLFYEGKQWMAEADLAFSEKLLLTTADPKISDQIRQKLESLGLKHESRQVQDFEQYDEPSEKRQSKELLDFKRSFFKKWPDEVNEKLGGLTPREALTDPKMRGQVKLIVESLESQERKLPKKQRYSFESLKRGLGL